MTSYRGPLVEEIVLFFGFMIVYLVGFGDFSVNVYFLPLLLVLMFIFYHYYFERVYILIKLRLRSEYISLRLQIGVYRA